MAAVGITSKIRAMRDIMHLLQSVEAKEANAADELLPLIYNELRRLAAGKMSSLPPGQTLQATALVHEAYLKLVSTGCENWKNRKHFFAAAAEAMRHILIDRARRRLRERHGAGCEHVDLDEVQIAAPAKAEILLRLDEALEELSIRSALQAEIVKLRFFVGLSESETAEIVQISQRTVQREWAYARAWLFERIGSFGAA